MKIRCIRWIPLTRMELLRSWTYIRTIREKYPELAWLEMRGMRNIGSHEYFGISLPIIWRAITQDLKPLAEGLAKLLQ